MLFPSYLLSEDFCAYKALFQKHGTSKKIKKGAVLTGATSSQHLSYYITSGIAKLSITNENGQEVIICFFGNGSVFPINCMGDTFVYEDYLQLIAVTDLETIEFQSCKIVDMTKERHELVPAIINRYGKYSIILVAKILMSTYNNAPQLLASFLYLYARQNGTQLSLTQDDLAKLTGISLRHAARAITKLRDDGIIRTHRNKIEIPDMALLKGCCCGELSETKFV